MQSSAEPKHLSHKNSEAATEAATATEQESPALYTAEDLMMTASQLEPRLTILAAKRYVSFFWVTLYFVENKYSHARKQ